MSVERASAPRRDECACRFPHFLVKLVPFRLQPLGRFQ
jgi:hypothetical protein